MVEVDGLEVHVVATPGHTADSLSFVLPAERAVLTGDTVLGRGTTVVAHPDGQLGAYLDSLDRLHALAEAHEIGTIWPGHGPVIDDALGALDYYIAHRAERLQQVESALAELQAQPHPEGVAADELPRRVVEIVYADVDPVLWGAAELSVGPSWPTSPGASDRRSRGGLGIGHTANTVTAAGIPFRRAGQVGDGGLRGAAHRGVGRRFPLVPRRPRPQLRQGFRQVRRQDPGGHGRRRSERPPRSPAAARPQSRPAASTPARSRSRTSGRRST